MIQIIQTYDCPKCQSVDIVKNGTDYKGDQKFHCHECQPYSTLSASARYTEDQKEMVLRALKERVSMRSITRLFSVARQTLVRWLLEKVCRLPELDATLDDAQPSCQP